MQGKYEMMMGRIEKGKLLGIGHFGIRCLMITINTGHENTLYNY